MEPKDNMFKIIKLQAENFKKLKAIEITPHGDTIMISGKNAAGKQQPVSEPVLTSTGWKPIGEIAKGEYVIGSNGKNTKVLGVYLQTERKTYEVKMVDGGLTRCGPEHLWTVSYWSGKNHLTKTITTNEMLSSGVLKNAGKARKFSIQTLSEPIQYSDTEMNLPVDPYALGVILGDGHIESTGYVSITSDEEIFDKINVSGYRDKHKHVFGTAHWSRPLVHLGLAGTLSHTKFVPPEYLTASSEDRASLLAGLLDTDGTAGKSWAEFTSTSEQLVNAVVNLGYSLGYACNKRNGTHKKYRYKGELKTGRKAWTVLIKSPMSPFRLERKSINWSPSKQRGNICRFIESIKQVEDEESVCIKVEATDGLYVTNDFIITHNTSVLDAIWFALAGKDALKMNPDPVRHGEKTAKVTLDLGKYTVVRTWSNGNSKLEITNNEGMKFGSPAGMLSSIVGDLSFDPLAFAGQSDKEQVKTLLELVDLPIDLYALDDDRKGLYESRTLVNRAVKHLDGKVAGFPPVNAPDTEINTSDIMSAMELATKTISDNKDVRFNYEFKQDAKDELTTSISALETELLRKQDRLVSIECEIDQLKPQVESLIDPDLTVFKDQLQNAEQINSNVRSMQQRNLIIEELDAEKNNSENLTAKIKEIDDLKERTIREAKMPIDGLGFNDLGVTFNDNLFKQCSSAEQLKVSLAIAMAMNPKLRVIRIMDGSLLDSSNMAIVEEMAHNNGFQVWCECVSETGKMGIYIEEGTVVHDNYTNPQVD